MVELSMWFVRGSEGTAPRTIEPRSPRASGAPEAIHLTSSEGAARSVANAIDPAYFRNETRFGAGFYAAEGMETAIMEVRTGASAGGSGQYGVRFNVNESAMKVLDLTDPAMAERFGYSGGEGQFLDVRNAAVDAGYNTIRFKSERAEGNNVVVLKDFDRVLTPTEVFELAPADRAMPVGAATSSARSLDAPMCTSEGSDE
jgi:hypothetical protein